MKVKGERVLKNTPFVLPKKECNILFTVGTFCSRTSPGGAKSVQ